MIRRRASGSDPIDSEVNWWLESQSRSYSCDLSFLSVSGEAKLDQNNYQTSQDTWEKIHRCGWSMRHWTLSLYLLANGGLDLSFTELSSSLNWGWFPWRKTKSYATCTKDASFLFMTICFL